MVAPAGPRPGWSRRAQYSLFFAFLGTIAAILVGVVLLLWSLASPSSFGVARGAAIDATAPLAAGIDNVARTATGLVSGAGDYWDAARQNGQLKKDRAALMRRMVEARAILQENAELKRMLGLRERSDAIVATGRIVGSSLDSPRRFAILSSGAGDGVAVGMPVRAAEGLIGRVIDAGRLASRVQLVSDRASFVPAKRLSDGLPAMIQGRGDGTVIVAPLEVGRNPFRPGDVMITSGTGGLYPPLVPVAKIVRLVGDDAVAVPIADPARVAFATVERPFEPAAIAAAAASSDD